MAKIKVKSYPTITQFGNHLEQGMLNGLTHKQQQWAKSKVKELENSGKFIHYGFIREEAKKIQ